MDFLIFFITLIFGFAIGYYICSNNYKKSGLLILEENKWTVDLHIPENEVNKRSFIVLKVIHGPIGLT